jgi:hypothetical protein
VCRNAVGQLAPSPPHSFRSIPQPVLLHLPRPTVLANHEGRGWRLRNNKTWTNISAFPTRYTQRACVVSTASQFCSSAACGRSSSWISSPCKGFHVHDRVLLVGQTQNNYQVSIFQQMIHSAGGILLLFTRRTRRRILRAYRRLVIPTWSQQVPFRCYCRPRGVIPSATVLWNSRITNVCAYEDPFRRQRTGARNRRRLLKG